MANGNQQNYHTACRFGRAVVIIDGLFDYQCGQLPIINGIEEYSAQSADSEAHCRKRCIRLCHTSNKSIASTRHACNVETIFKDIAERSWCRSGRADWTGGPGSMRVKLGGGWAAALLGRWLRNVRRVPSVGCGPGVRHRMGRDGGCSVGHYT